MPTYIATPRCTLHYRGRHLPGPTLFIRPSLFIITRFEWFKLRADVIVFNRLIKTRVCNIGICVCMCVFIHIYVHINFASKFHDSYVQISFLSKHTPNYPQAICAYYVLFLYFSLSALGLKSF